MKKSIILVLGTIFTLSLLSTAIACNTGSSDADINQGQIQTTGTTDVKSADSVVK